MMESLEGCPSFHIRKTPRADSSLACFTARAKSVTKGGCFWRKKKWLHYRPQCRNRHHLQLILTSERRQKAVPAEVRSDKKSDDQSFLQTSLRVKSFLHLTSGGPRSVSAGRLQPEFKPRPSNLQDRDWTQRTAEIFQDYCKLLLQQMKKGNFYYYKFDKYQISEQIFRTRNNDDSLIGWVLLTILKNQHFGLELIFRKKSKASFLKR